VPTLFLNCLYVGIGGALGTVLRYTIGLLPFSEAVGFPLTTLFINFSGAFLIGIIVAYADYAGNLDPGIMLFLKIGFCGGFTTFSTFSLETAQLLQGGNFLIAGSYIFASVPLCTGGSIFRPMAYGLYCVAK
jgi:fluoride exporter